MTIATVNLIFVMALIGLFILVAYLWAEPGELKDAWRFVIRLIVFLYRLIARKE